MKAIRIIEIVRAVGGTLLCGEETDEITSVCTDSREASTGSLFVPLIGERVNAHRFIENVFAQGAKAVFTSEHRKREDCQTAEGCYIYVEDTLRALQAFAAYYRSLFTLPVIGITGSVGKTTTKEMVAAALETKYRVLKTAGNMNSQVGLSLMMFEIAENTEIAVIEMGMSEQGEMERLAQIARPETVIMTNIGVSHIGQLGSQENIRCEKLNIINEMAAGGHLYLNNEDVLLKEIGKNSRIKTTEATRQALAGVSFCYYGLDQTADAYAKDIVTRGQGTVFTYVHGSAEEKITLSVLGIHNVGNAVAALMVAEQYGIEPETAGQGLQAYAPIAMRGQIETLNDITLIDDTYNASPDSIKSGINVLLELGDVKRRIAVLADVLELGEVSRDCHYEVGEYAGRQQAAGRIEVLVTIGREAEAIAEGARNQNPSMTIQSFAKNTEAIAYLKEIITAGDAILLKGSRGMHLEEIVAALKVEARN